MDLLTEMQAARASWREKLMTLRKSLSKLEQMVDQPVEEWDYHHFQLWSQGHACRWAAEIGSQLEREFTLYQAKSIQARDQIELTPELRAAWARLKWIDSLAILNQDDQPMMDAFRRFFEGDGRDSDEDETEGKV